MINNRPHTYIKRKQQHLNQLNAKFNWSLQNYPDYLMSDKNNRQLMQQLNDTIIFYCQSYSQSSFMENVPFTTHFKLWQLKHDFRKYCNHLKINHDALLVLLDPTKSQLLFDHALFTITINDILQNMTSHPDILDEPRYASYKYDPSTTSHSDDFIMLNYIVLYLIKTSSPLIKMYQKSHQCELIPNPLIDEISNLQSDLQYTLMNQFPTSPYPELNQLCDLPTMMKQIIKTQQFENNPFIKDIIQQHNSLLRKE